MGPGPLASRDRIDYLVGLGEALYLEESYGAAAELFRTALDNGQDLSPRAFERVFDWWATSLDRQAQSGLVDDKEVPLCRPPRPGDRRVGAHPGFCGSLLLAGRSPSLLR